MSANPSVIQLVFYSADVLEEATLFSAEDVLPYLQRPGVLWLHMAGVEDVALLERLGEILHLHPLAVEDVVNGPQRPKAEEYDEQDFIITHTASADGESHLYFEQFSLFVGHNYVLSISRTDQEACGTVRQRLHASRGVTRHHGVDYLMYALLDAIIDGYFPALEGFGERLEYLQEHALLRESPETLRDIQRAKHELLHLRRVLWPQRDLLNVLMRDDNNNLSRPVRHYLRDCYDHVAQLMDMVEIYREMAADLMDAYLSAISNRMNAVMKVLTIIATVFMPLTFIVGVYGMNFDYAGGRMPHNMPELHWPYGYVVVWGAMLLVALAMLYYFRWRGWVGRSDLPTARDLQCEDLDLPAAATCRRQRRSFP